MTDPTSVLPEFYGEAADPATPAERLRELALYPDLAPIVAANPSAGSDLLRELEARIVEALPMPVHAAIALMTHGTPTVATNHYRALGLRADNPTLAAITGNPNAPTDTLLRLAGAFPAQFCANPIFPLLLLENPNLPGEMQLPIVRSLLRYEGVPRAFLDWIMAYGMPEVMEAARLHVAVAGEAGPEWQQLAQAEIWKGAISESDDLLLELLGLGAVPEWILALLAGSADQSVRRAVARSPGASKAALKPLRRAGASGDLAGYVPPDPALDPAVLEWLAIGGRYARSLAARNPSTPAVLLDRLAADPERSVRQGVARNPSTPPRVLDRLAGDVTPDVRQLVARNAATPEATLARLAGDRSKEVRWTVARNPRTAHEILVRLADDAHPVVRQGVARNAATPPDLLAWLAEDDVWAVHRAVAQNPNAPAAILEKFAEDYTWSNMRVRLAVVRNPNVTVAILERLAGDLSVDVRREFMRHPATPAGARARILASSLEMCTRTSESFRGGRAAALCRRLANTKSACVGV